MKVPSATFAISVAGAASLLAISALFAVSLAACGGDASPAAASVDASAPPPVGAADTGATPVYGLTLLRETKLSKIFSSDADHYEASGVAVKNGSLTIVFDNMTSVGTVNGKLTKGSLGPGVLEDSQYEGVTSSTADVTRFFVVQETAGSADPRGKILTLDGNLTATASAFTDVSFTDENKGFEGVSSLLVAGEEKLLALCEANLCGDKGAAPGNGRVKVLAAKGDAFVTEATLTVPPQASFKDYSDIALFAETDGSYRVAIVSQESSALWVGALTTTPLALVGPGAVYTFPKDATGAVQYCDVEGVSFIDRTTLAMVSDKTSGDAPCNEKSESAHVFAIP